MHGLLLQTCARLAVHQALAWFLVTHVRMACIKDPWVRRAAYLALLPPPLSPAVLRASNAMVTRASLSDSKLKPYCIIDGSHLLANFHLPSYI